VQALLEVERSRDMSIQMNTNTSINNSSQLLVRCDGSQQYPRKLFTKKSQRFFIDCLRFSHNIFYECTGTIGSKSEIPIPRLPPLSRFRRAGGEGKRRSYMFVAGEGHDEVLGI
jgi:hypothetical protein